MDNWGFSGKIGFDPAADLSEHYRACNQGALIVGVLVWLGLVLAHVGG